MTTTIDVVQAVSVRTRRNVRTVTIDCPSCGRRHVHGWPLADPHPGMRTAHCSPGVGAVFILAPQQEST